jgi:sodium/bile acid cotransporter 7
MATSSWISRLRLDPYIVAIVGMVGLATVLPCRGQGAVVMDYATDVSIALLFFLYGGRLSRQAVVAGITHWRLQVVVALSTFVLFPALGLMTAYLTRSFISPALAIGVVFLSVLPSTVQSSIAFTSIARGNVAAAICCASLSNLVGVVVTPVLVAVLLSTRGQGVSFDAVRDIMLQLFFPFVAGQMLRRWISGWLTRNRGILSYVDRGTILLVVYVAFSKGVVNGIWHQVTGTSMLVLLVINALLLGAVLLSTMLLSRRLGFNKEDEIAIVFCGSKKSLASGVPMANILFAGNAVGLIVLPLMLFHQLQLMACAVIARRYAARRQTPVEVAPQEMPVAAQPQQRPSCS